MYTVLYTMYILREIYFNFIVLYCILFIVLLQPLTSLEIIVHHFIAFCD